MTSIKTTFFVFLCIFAGIGAVMALLFLACLIAMIIGGLLKDDEDIEYD